MFQAKIKGQSYNNGVLGINVTFTNGDVSNTEFIIPENDKTFKAWVKERINFYNSSNTLKDVFVEDELIDVSEDETPIEEVSEEVTARQNWLFDYYKYMRVLNTLVQGDILKQSDNIVVHLKKKVKDNFLDDYVNYI